MLNDEIAEAPPAASAAFLRKERRVMEFTFKIRRSIFNRHNENRTPRDSFQFRTIAQRSPQLLLTPPLQPVKPGFGERFRGVCVSCQTDGRCLVELTPTPFRATDSGDSTSFADLPAIRRRRGHCRESVPQHCRRAARPFAAWRRDARESDARD